MHFLLPWLKPSAVTITTHTGGLAQTNGYLLESEQGTIAIDAPFGMWACCQQRGIIPTGLLLTHQHFDHVEDAAAMARAGVPIHGCSPFSSALVLDEAARLMGLPITVEPFAVDHLLEDTTWLELAGVRFELLAVPGHSPDSFVFHVALFQKLFAGDTLFADSIGRTDLPGGNHALLIAGIRERLLTLPAQTEVHPGHGPPTTIGREAATNPFLS